MGRNYVVQNWNDAAAGYCGYQVDHFSKSGAANPKAYKEKPVEKKTKKVKKPDFRTKEQVREDFLDRKRIQFEKAFESGEIGFEQYEALLTEWEKARSRLDKRMGIAEDSKEVESKPSRPSVLPIIERKASTFASRHPFATLVGVIVLGSMIMNVFGYGA